MNEEKCAEPIRDSNHLEELLSTPTDHAIDAARALEGDWMILGAAGKMGPTLSRMVRRALDSAGRKARVIAVSRFSSLAGEEAFHKHNIETIRADLLDQKQLNALPDVLNVIYMTGMKFGSTGQEALTWAMNAYLPGMVAQKFSSSRIAAFSTGNIYGLSPVAHGGSVESDYLSPQGDYAMSCVGRERIFEHFSRTLLVPMTILRLNYAVEMRYGVLHDIGAKVMLGQNIDVAMGNANVIWQGDANAMAIASLLHASTPPLVLNITGPETLSVRRIAEAFGRLFGVAPRFINQESGSALLNNASRSFDLFGYPRVSVAQVIRWTADWLKRGGPTHGKPTHFETRDGKF